MVAWSYFTMPSEQELQQRKAEQARQDSIAAAQTDSMSTQQQTAPAVDSSSGQADAELSSDTQNEPVEMGAFSAASVEDTTETTVETPLYKATFTNVGAGPAQITLKEHETWDHQSIRMIKDTTQSAYSLGFLTNQNYNVETDELVFEPLTSAHFAGRRPKR